MTLVELLVVLAIVGLILGMSIPGLSTYTKQVRLKTATRQLLGLVSLARSMAISSHEDHGVVWDDTGHALRVVNTVSGEAMEQVLHLPSSVTLEVRVGGEVVQAKQVVFRPTGSLAGRTTSLVLSDKDKHQTITITGPTGAVNLE